jgi:antirestriction protein ArdC
MAGDFIQIPEFRQFREPTGYYSTLAHEHVHWTGAANRLAREFGRRFGDEAYAFEELIAELGAAFLCAGLGLSNEPRPDHAAYIASWLRVLKGEKRAIFTAASKAQAAADYLAGFQTTETQLAA